MQIEECLAPIAGYLKSMNRDTVKGQYELEVGIPKNWVFDENLNIGIEIVLDNEFGKLVRVFPKKPNIIVDDLVDFVEIIMKTNQKIAEKEKEFTIKMEEMKKSLEKQASEFYKELDELKDNSFKKLSGKFIAESNSEEVEPTKRGRKPKIVVDADSENNS